MLALNSEIQNNTVELTENKTKNWNHNNTVMLWRLGAARLIKEASWQIFQ